MNYKFSIIVAVYNVEQYIDETMESLINQDIGFEENVQVILVNDGSTDDSLSVLQKYAQMYPNNVLVLSKENGGQASARNLGLNYVEGEFINFLDSDDKLSLNALSHVYNFSKKHDVNILSIPMFFFDKMEDEHLLNHPKFDEEVIIDVFEKFDYPQLSISSSFIKSFLFEGYNFDSRFNLGEDAVLINKILLNNPKIAFLNKAKYFYRKRQDNSSTLDTIDVDLLYFDKMKYFHEELIKFSVDKLGYVPNFIQYVIAYDLQWYCAPSLFEPEDKRFDLFMENLLEILTYIDLDIISKHKYIKRVKKTFLVYLKNDQDFYVEKTPRNRILIKSKDYILNRLHRHNIFLDYVELLDNCLDISGCLISYCKNDAITVYATVESNGSKKTFTGNRVDYPETYRKTYYCLGVPWRFYYNFEFKIPIDAKENYKVYFKIKYDENNVSTEFDPKIKFRPTSNLSEISNYYVKNSKIVLFRRKSIHVVDYSYKFLFKLEWNVLRNILSSDEDHALKSIGIRLIYLLIFVFMKNRIIWLFMDRVSDADDNGEQIFKYAVNQNDGIEKYYVIEKDSDDFNRLSKQYKNILIFNSFKHNLLLLFTQKIVTSHPDQVIINPYVYSELNLFRGISNKDTYFLQHGVTKDNIASWLRKYDKYLRLILTVSEMEYNSFLEPGYNYDESIIQTLGFPRFDYLNNDNVEKQITVMPSWRRSLENVDVSTFLNSEYYTNWMSLMNNPKLIEFAKENNYKIVFKPHPKFKEFLPMIDIGDHITVDDERYQDIFNRSSMIITDYSSVFFDFAYLKKPLFYYHYADDYHFDVDKSYFDYEKMGFGDVVDNSDDLVEKIIDTIKNGCVMEEKYQKRVDEFFKFTDKNNCKRVYEWIKKN